MTTDQHAMPMPLCDDSLSADEIIIFAHKNKSLQTSLLESYIFAAPKEPLLKSTTTALATNSRAIFIKAM